MILQPVCALCESFKSSGIYVHSLHNTVKTPLEFQSPQNATAADLIYERSGSVGSRPDSLWPADGDLLNCGGIYCGGIVQSCAIFFASFFRGLIVASARLWFSCIIRILPVAWKETEKTDQWRGKIYRRLCLDIIITAIKRSEQECIPLYNTRKIYTNPASQIYS